MFAPDELDLDQGVPTAGASIVIGFLYTTPKLQLSTGHGGSLMILRLIRLWRPSEAKTSKTPAAPDSRPQASQEFFVSGPGFGFGFHVYLRNVGWPLLLLYVRAAKKDTCTPRGLSSKRVVGDLVASARTF